jgi:cation transport ATPase
MSYRNEPPKREQNNNSDTPRNYLKEYEEYREKKRIEQNRIEQKRILQKEQAKTKATIVYMITIIVGIISTILSFVFLDESNMMILMYPYAISIIVFYFGGYFIFDINKVGVTKICVPLFLPIFIGLIIGYIFPSYDTMILTFKTIPIFITISALLFERELLY